MAAMYPETIAEQLQTPQIPQTSQTSQTSQKTAAEERQQVNNSQPNKHRLIIDCHWHWVVGHFKPLISATWLWWSFSPPCLWCNNGFLWATALIVSKQMEAVTWKQHPPHHRNHSYLAPFNKSIPTGVAAPFTLQERQGRHQCNRDEVRNQEAFDINGCHCKKARNNQQPAHGYFHKRQGDRAAVRFAASHK